MLPIAIPQRHARVSVHFVLLSITTHAYATSVLAVELSYLQVLGKAPTDL